MKNKLYTKAQIGFKIPISVSGGTALFQPAGNIPMITWPDGSWCFPANVYMLDLLKHGRSRAGGGGTLLTYASNISHLIRFCASNGIDLTEITDSYFTLFVKSLASRNKNDASSCLPRNMNTVINIARNSLDLLATAGKLRGIINFVSEDGIIRATKKETKSKRFRGSRISMSWYHHSFPNPDTSKKRLPVTDGAHHALMEAAAQTKNIFIRKRRFIMLHLLECTGCRRSELVRIEVNDVLALQGKQRPLLKVFTAKKRFNEVNYRFIPISPPDVVILLDYVTKNRAPVIGRTVGHDNDHGMLLISQLTGQPIYANTITQELRALALNTSLGEPISPHLYRHRFITMLSFISFDNTHLKMRTHFAVRC